jgi:hypothetical protein
VGEIQTSNSPRLNAADQTLKGYRVQSPCEVLRKWKSKLIRELNDISVSLILVRLLGWRLHGTESDKGPHVRVNASVACGLIATGSKIEGISGSGLLFTIIIQRLTGR